MGKGPSFEFIFIDPEKTGRAIKELREVKGDGLNAAARKSGLTVAGLRGLERGAAQKISTKNIERLIKYFNIEKEKFIFERSEPAEDLETLPKNKRQFKDIEPGDPVLIKAEVVGVYRSKQGISYHVKPRGLEKTVIIKAENVEGII